MSPPGSSESLGYTGQTMVEESQGAGQQNRQLELAGEGTQEAVHPVPQALGSHHPAVLLHSFWGQSRMVSIEAR